MKKRVVVEIFKFAPVLFILAFLGEASAAIQTKNLKAKCSTPRGIHRFVINKTEVNVQKGWDKLDERLPASAASVNTRTRYTMKGFKKYFKWNQDRYFINIENKASFSEVEDFVVIQNNKGHEITYPLNCENLK